CLGYRNKQTGSAISKIACFGQFVVKVDRLLCFGLSLVQRGLKSQSSIDVFLGAAQEGFDLLSLVIHDLYAFLRQVIRTFECGHTFSFLRFLIFSRSAWTALSRSISPWS